MMDSFNFNCRNYSIFSVFLTKKKKVKVFLIILIGLGFLELCNGANLTDLSKTSSDISLLDSDCHVNEFRCTEGKCIPQSKKCDNSRDCSDGSDEHDCEIKCNEGQFLCAITKKCILNDWLCDGQVDCNLDNKSIKDNSDEDPKRCNYTKCLPNQSECANGFCLDIANFCDGNWDCDNDELNCVNATQKCSELKCSYDCKLTPSGPMCFCAQGQAPNGTLCHDFDECTIQGTCDQICKNTPGSFECSCTTGYFKNNTKCFAMNIPKSEPASILALTRNSLVRLTMNGDKWNEKSKLNISNIQAMEIWHSNRSACIIESEITCVNVDDFTKNFTLPRPDLFPDLKAINYFSIDWISGNWYFLNIDIGMIYVCNNSMKHCTIIMQYKKLKNFAIDPTKGFIFISIWEKNPAVIERTLMDGTNQTNLVSKQLTYPCELTLDFANQHVYWIDIYTNYIGRVNYDGTKHIVKNTDVRPMSHIFLELAETYKYNSRIMSILENKIYVAAIYETLLTIDRHTFNTNQLKNTTSRLTELSIFHRQKQPDSAHPCRDNNGGCQQLCITAWKKNIATIQCLCSPGYRLIGKFQCSFVEQSTFIIYDTESPSMIRGFGLTNKASKTVINKRVDDIVPITNISAGNIVFDYNFKDKTIYFAHKNLIESQNINGSNRKIILEVRSVNSLAYDWMGQNLFFTNTEFKSICAFKLNHPSTKKIILRENYIPTSIVLDPQAGMMYYCVVSSTNLLTGIIYKAWMDGTHKTLLLTENGKQFWPSSLSIDRIEKKIYWCDLSQKTIERIGIDGQNREVLYESKSNSFTKMSMVFFNRFIYFTNKTEESLQKIFVGDKTTEPSTVIYLNQTVSNLKFFNKIEQIGSNQCSKNDKCPDESICINTPNDSICVCGDGYSLNGSGKKCVLQGNYTAPTECKEGFTKCKTNNQCINKTFICDGDRDCLDGSDEATTPNGPCEKKLDCDFICDDTRCLNESQKCNGITTCIDGTDESPENCPVFKKCNEHEFQCEESGFCIPKGWLCDGIMDCGPKDRSDEADGCGDCVEYECENKVCISYELLCNGIDNCGDKSDESYCHSECKPKEIYCQPIGCISESQICDGIIDCFDEIDEHNCNATKSDNEKSRPLFACGSNEEQCSNKIECYPKYFRCDGKFDCLDKSDEANCTKIQIFNETITCENPDRLCKSTNECIRVDQLCDGQTDCPDGSDEGIRCSEKLCDHSTDCSHYCNNSPEGIVCSCPAHLFLKTDQTTCSYEHACKHWGTCSQECEQVGKTHRCKCQKGYSLAFDGFSCKSDKSDAPTVIFSNRQEIRGIDLNTLAVKVLYASLRNTIALDFLYTNESVQIFWTDVIDDMIYRGTLIGGDSLSNVEAVITSGLSTAEGLAVDWIGQNLYWVDSNLDQIEVARVNGNFRRTLVAGDMESPRAIALDPREGLLFWTDWDERTPRIERCSMAGELRKIIFKVDSIGGAWPNGLTLDYNNKRVYWIDAKSDSIHTIDYEGEDHHLVIRDEATLSHPFGISLFENHIYWTDWRSNSVFRANKWNGSDVSLIQRTLTQPFGIQILHPSRQLTDNINPCFDNNGGCSHLCLLSVNNTFLCACPHVMALDKDKKMCLPNEQVLLIVMTSEIRGVDLLQPNHHTIPTISHQTQVVQPSKLDFVVSDGKVYWIDLQLGEVKSSGLSSGPIVTILDTDITNPSAFAIDWISKNMYLAYGHDKHRIIVCNLDGEYITDVHSELENVVSIAVDPANGKLYWSHANFDTNTYHIETSSLDGSNRETIANCTEPLNNLVIDYEEKRLYFVHKNISYYDLVKQTVNQLLENDPNESEYTSITVYKDFLYYQQGNSIKKCKKIKCENSEILRNNTAEITEIKMYYPNAQTGTNSCAKNRGGCQHLCLSVSSEQHVCKCAVGFFQDPVDSSKCIGVEEFVLYSVGHKLKGVVLHPTENLTDDDSKVLAPLSRISIASKIDFHAKSDFIYWADSEKSTITRIKRDGTNRQLILFNKFEQLELNSGDWLAGLAIDWIGDNIYWSDQKRGIIEVARLNGTARYVILSNIEKPSSIAVDPINGLLFYAGYGHIGRTGLDGSQPFILVNQTAVVTSLSLDINNQVVYWSETTSDTIMKSDYDGNLKTVLLSQAQSNPVAIAVVDNFMYWADTNHIKGTIKFAPLTNLTDYSIIVRSDDDLKDLKIFSKRIQKGKNGCSVLNGGCEELCLFNGTHPVCACSHGRIAKNLKNCESYENFLIYSRVTGIESIHMTDKDNMNGPIAKITNSTFVKNTIGLSYDYKRQRIFYSDIHWGSINWVYFNGSDHQLIVNKQVSVEGLAYDSISDQLFWTSNSNASIRSINMNEITSDTTNNAKLVKRIVKLKASDKPRGIAIEPCLTMVYWTNWNAAAASIQRAYISGYGLENIITTDIKMPNAIALDYEGHKLYWADARLDKIESADYDGSHRIVLAHSTPKHPFAMAIYGDLLFWTDWVLHGVVRANKYTGSELVFLRKDVTHPMGIVAVQDTAKNCSANLCQILNGGCEDVCLIDISNKIKCQCTQGVLAGDGRKCVPKGKKCEPNEFECATGDCIPLHLACDNVSHCIDGSDESIRYCSTRICPSLYFQCDNHRCIPSNQTCDKIQNCGDGSDEENCNCSATDFQCKTGQCISAKHRCDNDPDCSDLSDEIGCPKRDCNLDLHQGLFLNCKYTTACYHKEWLCNGENDCWDNSDEMNCTTDATAIRTCDDDEFLCANGQCIKSVWQCDGEDDCWDGTPSSDEMNCDKNCKANQFKCLDGTTCIPNSWQCDNTPDCPDGSDEGDHCAVRTCSENEFKCTFSGRCIPLSWVCDHEVDCFGDGEDESLAQNCRNADTCPEDHFRCLLGDCIEIQFACDGFNDCEDGSDEAVGCVPGVFAHTNCSEDEFYCNNRKCIPKNETCNFSDDCGDNSDESVDLCKNSTVICAGPDMFRCANGVCISEKLLCDGRDDCGDFSDEQACNINECERVAGQLCEHKCEDKKVGYECSCNTGYKVSHEDRHRCEDIDECLDRPCSQNCYNTFGSYHCGCINGYSFKDNITCKATSEIPVKLIFSNRYYIRDIDLSGHMNILAHNLSNAVALDYDWQSKCYFWSDVTTALSSIRKLCDNKTTTLHVSTLKNPDGIAVDWVGRNLYWCDKGLDTIEVSTLDGKYRRVIINKDLQEPRAVVLDPYERYMYWTDWGDRPHIGKAGMDGSNQRILIEDDMGWPNALTISFETSELFWGDAREDYIAVSDMEGNNRKIIISREKNPAARLHHIFAIAVWEDKIYYTDWETKTVEQCHKYRGDNCSKLVKMIHRPMDLRVYHPYRQSQPEVNLCASAGCSTLCLLTPESPGFKCMCPDNFILAADNKTCTANCTSAHFICETTYKCIPFYWKCDTQDDCGDGSDEPDHCPSFSCAVGQFQCKNSQCVQPHLICDSHDDCGDNSDEADCDDYVCFNSQFKCEKTANTTAHCIDNWKRCNNIVDCPNGDDEKNCTAPSCKSVEFLCDTGKCVPKVWVCDGEPDCNDQTDELNCQDRVCGVDEYRCKSGRCIHHTWICDGESDCPDNEDEHEDCLSGTNTCQPTYFRCDNGKCIPGRWQCDYDNDCNDNSDERNCTMRSCSESEFRCSDGRCIRGTLKCDGDFNCEDQSDEEECEFICKDDEFKCVNQNVCLAKSLKCDGDLDCSDGSDEKDCECSEHEEFKCADGICILNDWRCDGWSDCSDGSDETPALCSSINCNRNAYRCKNDKCVSKSVICDGEDDCGDGTDERPDICHTFNKCPNDQFLCQHDKNCISKALKCDGDYNCADLTDELNCKEPVCKFDACSQICIEKKIGNYSCKCAHGFRKGLDKNETCYADGPEQILFMASDSRFRFLLPQKHVGGVDKNPIIAMGTVTTASKKIDSFDTFMTDDYIILFWIDSVTNNILKLKMKTVSDAIDFDNRGNRRARNSEEETEIVIKSLVQPKSISVDWINYRLYIIDAKSNTIISSNLRGDFIVSIVSTEKLPLDLVLNPETRTIFWSTKENGIFSAGMDGSMKTKLVQHSIQWPTGLCIDYPAQRLYWADQRKGTVESVLLDGSSRQVVHRFSKSAKPHRVDVFEDFLYVTLFDQSLMKLNKYSRDNGTYLLHKFHKASDIVLVHPYKQNVNISNPCNENPCDPGSICLLSTSLEGRKCVCSENMISTTVNNSVICSVNTIVPKCSLKCYPPGNCIFENGRQKCKCPPEFDGSLCQHFRCSGYCLHKGICSFDYLNHIESEDLPRKCSCASQWMGKTCELLKSDCQKLCHNGATCSTNDSGNESCICPIGFTGPHCQHCTDLRCENNGICRKNEKSQCDCPDGYNGKMCENNICDGYCQHGVCSIQFNGPQCACTDGYRGKNCELDNCIGFCKNGGICTDRNHEKTCECPGQYAGKQCEIDRCTTANPPSNCTALKPKQSGLCSTYSCNNGGSCLEIRNQPICNCTIQWNGENCEQFVGHNNPCVNYCENSGICHLSSSQPTCTCIGEWIGRKCDSPPNCIEECGVCLPDSSINECACSNGTVRACIYDLGSKGMSDEKLETGRVLTVLAIIIGILSLLVSLVGGAIYFVRKRRGSSFAHARLNDNVEITNPMYLNDVDDAPAFVHEPDKVHFANPVYESMYAEGISMDMTVPLTSGVPEERGLLQHTQDESTA